MTFSQLAIGRQFVFGTGFGFEVVEKTKANEYKLVFPGNRINEQWRGEVDNMNQAVFETDIPKRMVTRA